MQLFSIICSALLFASLSLQSWNGTLGLSSVIILPLSIVLFVYGKRKLSKSWANRITFIAKLLMTIIGVVALLRHPIETDVQDVSNGSAIVHIRASKAQTVLLTLYDQTQTSSVISLDISEGKSQSTIRPQRIDSTPFPNGTYRIRVEGENVRPASRLPIYRAIYQYIDQVDRSTFIFFALCAMLIKFFGVMSSAYAWHLLLRGQGIIQPYFQATFTAFLIGRFIGTFLPSTIGLDGYTFYEAARYSNQKTKVAVAKVLEKFIGITGLFLGMVLTLPFGYQVIVDVAEKINRPDVAPALAGTIALVAGGISSFVIIGLIRPGILRILLLRIARFLPQKVSDIITSFSDAVFAYEGRGTLILTILVAKFLTHFTTAVVYFFTALAIGAITLGMSEFWPIVFGSNIQILATILSPTIAGEGAREAFQALLLEKRLGGIPQAVLSGALGFIAAEAATMWGGAFWWLRKESWRPNFMLVDGVQVDYSWLKEPSDFEASGEHS
jgi:hypothetical protein